MLHHHGDMAFASLWQDSEACAVSQSSFCCVGALHACPLAVRRCCGFSSSASIASTPRLTTFAMHSGRPHTIMVSSTCSSSTASLAPSGLAVAVRLFAGNLNNPAAQGCNDCRNRLSQILHSEGSSTCKWTMTFAHIFSPGTATTSSHRGPHVTHGKIQTCHAVKMDPVRSAYPRLSCQSPCPHRTSRSASSRLHDEP